jgi:hypothetical protein
VKWTRKNTVKIEILKLMTYYAFRKKNKRPNGSPQKPLKLLQRTRTNVVQLPMVIAKKRRKRRSARRRSETKRRMLKSQKSRRKKKR